MTTDKQIEAMARAIYDSLREQVCLSFVLPSNCVKAAEAAIDVLRIELSSILHVGGVKHPQQLQWGVMMDEIRELQRQANNANATCGETHPSDNIPFNCENGDSD